MARLGLVFLGASALVENAAGKPYRPGSGSHREDAVSLVTTLQLNAVVQHFHRVEEAVSGHSQGLLDVGDAGRVLCVEVDVCFGGTGWRQGKQIIGAGGKLRPRRSKCIKGRHDVLSWDAYASRAIRASLLTFIQLKHTSTLSPQIRIT